MAIRFDQYVLDPEKFELRHAGERVPMEPQVFDVLLLLVTNHDRVVTKDELMEKVWGDKYISEAALNSRVMSARKAVGDNGRDQRLIRTVHGRGYRFVGRVADGVEPSEENGTATAVNRVSARLPVTVAAVEPVRGLLGREAEMALLRGRLQQAGAGRRQVVLISGEAGMGKTTLVEAFAAEAQGLDVRIGRGQCLEHRSEGEPYMPVLEALGRLCRGNGGRAVVEQINQHAPTWLAQMPAFIDESVAASLHQRTVGATRERMLREMVECLDNLTANVPLLLILEDLHWSDRSTLDLLSMLARRGDPARLLIVATYRPGDAALGGHPLYSIATELKLRGYAEELALDTLPEEAVEAYVEARLGAPAPQGFSASLARRTGGNPLYMQMVLDAWLAEGLVDQSGSAYRPADPGSRIPESLQAYIEQRMTLLSSEERSLLEAASVVGRNFSAAAVSAALGRPLEDTEATCESLAKLGRFIRRRGVDEWPDGTVSEGYSFLHDLYQEVLYESISASRLVRLHAAAGQRLETAYGETASEMPWELAVHFVRGRNYEKALRYLRLAGEQARRRSADEEAAEHVEKALELLRTLPPGRERDENELILRMQEASLFISRRGWSAAEVERSYDRALALAESLRDEASRSVVLFGIATMYEVRGEYQRAAQMITQRTGVAAADLQRAQLESCELMACSSFHQGLFMPALEHAEEGFAIYEAQRRADFESEASVPYSGAVALGDHPAISCLEWAALSLWFLGKFDEAAARVQQALKLAEQPGNDYSSTLAYNQAAVFHQIRGDAEQALRMSEVAITRGREYGYGFRVAWGSIVHGWARARLGDVEAGIEEIKRGMQQSLHVGARMDHAYYQALLADAHRLAGDWRAGLAIVEEALQSISGGRPFFYHAELLRLKAALLPDGDGSGGARDCLVEAIRIAREQGAWPLELRAALELARSAPRDVEARAALEQACRSVQAHPDVPELQEARALIQSRA